MKAISIEMLRSLMSYDPVTGQLTWKERPGATFFNKVFAGTEALGSVANSRGYRHGTLLGHKVTAHRVAYALYTGEWPQGEVDHINGCKTDNSAENLREVTPSENCRNQRKPRNNTSGVIGVWFDKRRGRWRAEARHGGMNHKLGTFDTKEDAVAARALASARFGYHPNHGRDGAST
jgi:hypothetical protein